jgi:hypothetical protein
MIGRSDRGVKKILVDKSENKKIINVCIKHI